LLDESDAVMIERVSNVVRVLQKTKDETLSWSMVPSGGVATLGFMSRRLGWGSGTRFCDSHLFTELQWFSPRRLWP